MVVVKDGQPFKFEFEWVESEGVSAPELRATWARLTISVGDDCLTQVEDAATRSVRRSIYVPLYPLAEWIAYSWWHLRSDARPAYLPERDWSFRSRLRMSDHRSSWLTHHNLRAIGEGLPWPDVTLIPTGNNAIVAWQRDRSFLPRWKVRFLSTGSVTIDRSALEASLGGLVDAVLTRLDEFHVSDTPLADEWNALRALSREEADYCSAAARLGLDPFDSAPEIQELIVQSAAELPPTLLDDFLDGATPGRLRDEVDWVRAQWRTIAKSHRATVALPGLANGRSTDGGLAWQKGVRDARELRSLLQASPRDPFDVHQWVAVEKVPTVTRSLQGLGGPTTTDGCLVALAEPRSDEGERFALARALWRFLRPGESREFLVTAARTPIQQAERAFAAELLAPAEGIAEMLYSDPDETIDTEEIRPISHLYGVSDWVVEYQLLNQLDREVDDPKLGREA